MKGHLRVPLRGGDSHNANGKWNTRSTKRTQKAQEGVIARISCAFCALPCAFCVRFPSRCAKPRAGDSHPCHDFKSLFLSVVLCIFLLFSVSIPAFSQPIYAQN